MRPRNLLLILLPALLFPIAPLPVRTASAGEAVKLSNPQFAEWGKGLPAGWTRSVGARRDPGDTATRIAQVEGGGVALEGDAKTNLWHMLSQPVKAAPGSYLQLSALTRATGRRHEAGQYGSCYVGLVFRDHSGGFAGFAVEDVRHDAWRTSNVYVRVPEQAAAVEAAIFLSMTGRLEVRGIAVQRLAAKDSFGVLWHSISRHYSFLGPHKIPWAKMAEAYEKPLSSAATPADFIKKLKPALAGLEDGHVWIQAPDGTKTWTHTPKVVRNFELNVVMNRVEKVQQVVRNVLAGRTTEGYGYLALGTMQLSPQDYAQVEHTFRGLFQTKGIILDLRVNGGGAESIGQGLCGYLTKKRVLYGRSLIRSGPRPEDLMQGGDRHVVPAKSGHYDGHVVVLVGPGCVSSGEGMAMMLKALPNATLVGLPTRGSSGNPQPVHLPNGVSVWFSRWISQLPDGTGIERTGVPPDVRIEHVPGKDPALEKAIKILKAKADKR